MQMWTDWCRLCNSKFHSFLLAWSFLFTVGIVTSFLPKPFQTTFQNQLVVKSWFRHDIIKASSKAILKTGTVFRKLILKHLNRERIKILDINCAFTEQCLMSSYYSVVISIFFSNEQNKLPAFRPLSRDYAFQFRWGRSWFCFQNYVIILLKKLYDVLRLWINSDDTIKSFKSKDSWEASLRYMYLKPAQLCLSLESPLPHLHVAST